MAEFKESEHPRDKDGKFTDKNSTSKSKFRILFNALKKRKVRINLQFFSEKAIKNQTDEEIKSGIKNLKKVRELHEYKISHPQEYYVNWDKMSKIEQEGRLWTWQKEINNHTKGIDDRLEELRKRGEENGKT
ncbi:MAG: hypothetical protein IJX51_05475 [Clostridia bacterium]|nr:hypothetical protein [Clostridia bacterium]